MPSTTELHALGLNALACKVSRTRGGFRGWASHLGLSLKDSNTTFGQAWEAHVAAFLRELDYRVEAQTTKAPFDLLVEGRCRVNVKAATYHAYGACRGYFFGIGDTWRNCDVLALVKVPLAEEPSILWVPAHEARQATITLTERHRFNHLTDVRVIDSRVSR